MNVSRQEAEKQLKYIELETYSRKVYVKEIVGNIILITICVATGVVAGMALCQLF